MNENDLRLYLQKIGFAFQVKPNLMTLKKLQNLHQQTFAFENLYPFLKIPVLLDWVSLRDKFLIHHRGGYCFEQNLMFSEVLKFIGFQVKWTLARVHSDEIELGRTHLLLLVEIEGKTYLSDVGFGGWVYAEPLELVASVEQKNLTHLYRIDHQEGEYQVKVNFQNSWQTLYSFNLNQYLMADIRVANWYTSTHPLSHFTHQLVLAIRDENQTKMTLRNGLFSIYEIGQEPIKKELKNGEELTEVIERYFHVEVSQLANWESEARRLFI